jgi:tRNA threonylcarbamoyladenosine biosynthesis protein TsaE
VRAPLSVRADSAEETKELGRRLGRALQVGDVVGLVGPLGAGKTTFAQGIAQGLEVPADRNVASPTFALVNEHPGRVPLVHADLYRIERDGELRELGLDEAVDRAAMVVEWLDRFPGAVPADHLIVEIAFGGSGSGSGSDGRRLLTPRASGPRSQRLAAVLAAPSG